MPSLDESVCNIVEIYGKYANAQGKLTKDDLKRMMEEQIKNPALKVRQIYIFFIFFGRTLILIELFVKAVVCVCVPQAKICADNCEKVMGCADKNKDGEITCDEFKKFVGHMMKCCYEHKMGCKGCDQ